MKATQLQDVIGLMGSSPLSALLLINRRFYDPFVITEEVREVDLKQFHATERLGRRSVAILSSLDILGRSSMARLVSKFDRLVVTDNVDAMKLMGHSCD